MHKLSGKPLSLTEPERILFGTFPGVSSGTCPECAGIHPDASGDIEFSWNPCDICKSPLGGARYILHEVWRVSGTRKQEIIHLEVCIDCFETIVYGDESEGRKENEIQ